MNMNAVYELRERLELAAVAGVNLIQEDFRLERAIGQMEPLAKASPVFQKITVMAKSVRSPGCEDRAGILLDTLALLDAVICTQGTLQNEGELKDMDVPADGGDGSYETFPAELYAQMPCSRLAPLVEAFTGKGSGRYAVICEAHEEMPELFWDYRIRNYMVNALGDSYGELADLAARWLKTEGRGRGLIPLIKQGFRPDGRREMVRRIEVIEALAGKEENDFYRMAVCEGSGEVKEAAILALRHDQGNLPLLLDLVKTEKGRRKDAVCQGLACMDGREAEDYWEKAMKKDAGKTLSFLRASRSDWASELVAEEFERRLADQADADSLEPCAEAAYGKHSPRLCACLKQAFVTCPDPIGEMLSDSLIAETDPALCRTAEELYQLYGDTALQPVIVKTLLTASAGEVYERFCRYLKPDGIKEKLTGKRPVRDGLFKAFGRIFYDKKAGGYRIVENHGTPAHIIRYECLPGRILPEGIDPRWIPLLMEYPGRLDEKWSKGSFSYGSQYDEMLAMLYDPEESSLQQPYGDYFYQRILRYGARKADLEILKKCGWKRYEGILTATLEKISLRGIYGIQEVIAAIPLEREKLAEELDEYLRKNQKRAVQGTGFLERWRDKLKNGLDV